ncbi:30S ribosomal protein S4 [Candidatus Parcubacteria bacterium]|nr:30S ribosomal protein S4 [Candidatus Parcubacteria bacterium]
MAKDLSSKCKKCRRAGEKLFLKGERCNTPKCAMVKRNYPPGFHGSKGRRRITGYGMQLNEKQKAKRQYNLLEKQFRLTFDKARKKSGDAGENFLQLLEMRIDNAIYRAGLASSRSQARQLVNHGHFTVNGEKVTIPSYILKSGDLVSVKKTKKDSKFHKSMLDVLQKKEIPGWMNFDKTKNIVKILHKPGMDMIKPNFQIRQIIEYYSK